MMKKIFLFILATISFTAFSQTLTLEKIFTDGVLRSENVSGFQPMPASDFYTVTSTT